MPDYLKGIIEKKNFVKERLPLKLLDFKDNFKSHLLIYKQLTVD